MADHDKILVRLLVRGFTIMSQLLRCFETPKGMQEAVIFTSKNLERVSDRDDEKTWKGTRIKKIVSIDTVTNLGTELHWMSMRLNIHINAYRRALGLKTIDFERDAKIYDTEVRRGEKSIDDRRA